MKTFIGAEFLFSTAVPNILSHMASNQQPAKKSVQSKRLKELDNSELADLLSDLLPLVRLQHVLPAGQSDLVQAVIRRELVRCPPALYLVQAAPSDFVHCWIRGAAPPSAAPAPPPGPGNGGARGTRNSPPSCGPASPGAGMLARSIVPSLLAPPPPVQFMPPRLFAPFYEEVKVTRARASLC